MQAPGSEISALLTTLISGQVQNRLKLDSSYYHLVYGAVKKIIEEYFNWETGKIVYENINYELVGWYLLYLLIVILLFYSGKAVIKYLATHKSTLKKFDNHVVLSIKVPSDIDEFTQYIDTTTEAYDQQCDISVGSDVNLKRFCMDMLRIEKQYVSEKINDIQVYHTPNVPINFVDNYTGFSGYYTWKAYKLDDSVGGTDETKKVKCEVYYPEIHLVKNDKKPIEYLDKIKQFNEEQRQSRNVVTLTYHKIIDGDAVQLVFYQGKKWLSMIWQ